MLNFVFAQEDVLGKVNLSDMIVKGEKDERAKQLVQEVIKNQKRNSPKHLEEYQFKSYTKFLAKTIYDDIPDFEPKNKKDSANIKSYKEGLRAHDVLIEKGMIYAYNRKNGEKIITDAARISGLQTPLLEIAAINPLPYEFNQEEFNFFYFRKFVNPLSSKGLQHYVFKIQDTILLNNRKTIEVSFKNIGKKVKSLYGSLFIDKEDKALVEFSAEYQDGRGAEATGVVTLGSGGINLEMGGKNNYYLYSKYQKVNGVWFPKSQEYYRKKESVYHVDSESNKKYHNTDIISAVVDYSDIKTIVTLDKSKFKGYKNEITKEAFNDFDSRIQNYRKDKLSFQEEQTYVVLDSIGKSENINEAIKYGRFFVNGYNLPINKINLYLPSLYDYNGYEGSRFGAKISTNQNFHDRIGVEGSLHYGIKDKKLKYMLGANYVVEQRKNSLLGFRYTDDVAAFGRPVSPLRTGLNYFREYETNGNNSNYFGYRQFEVYTKTTFFENLDFLSSASIDKEKSLIPYEFNGEGVNKTYNQIGVNFNFRYSPNNNYISMPYGRVNTNTGYPNFYLTGDYSTPLNNDGYKSLRLQLSAEHSFSWFNKTAHLLVRGGRVFGDAPLWKNFNQGMRGGDKWFKPFSLGSSNSFETMPAMQFYSDKYVMAQWRQEWFKLKRRPVYTVLRGIYGDFEHKEMHSYQFDTLEKGYFEGGIEVRKILFNSIGLGAYYRFGDYKTDKFKENFAVKFTLDLPFGKVNF